MQIENIKIFYFKDKSTRISQPLTCVAQFVLGVSISKKQVGITSKKRSGHFLSGLAEL